MASGCENFTSGTIGLKAGTSEAIVGRLRCKQWSCAYCADKNRQRWLAVILDRLNKTDNEVWVFLTLTSHRKMRGWESSIKCLRDGWKKMSNRIRYIMKQTNETLSYVYVLEQHKDGTAHMHVMLNYLPHDFKPHTKAGSKSVKDMAVSCGMGYQCKTMAIPFSNAGKISSYITKYMVKMDKPLPKNTRRVQTTRDFKYVSVPNDEYDWSYESKLDDNVLLALMIVGGKNVYSMDYKREVTIDDIDNGGVYGGAEDSAK